MFLPWGLKFQEVCSAPDIIVYASTPYTYMTWSCWEICKKGSNDVALTHGHIKKPNACHTHSCIAEVVPSSWTKPHIHWQASSSSRRRRRLQSFSKIIIKKNIKNAFSKSLSENIRDTIWLISVRRLPVTVVKWSCNVTTKDCPIHDSHDKTMEHLIMECNLSIEKDKG